MHTAAYHEVYDQMVAKQKKKKKMKMSDIFIKVKKLTTRKPVKNKSKTRSKNTKSSY